MEDNISDLFIGIDRDFPAVSGIEDFWPKPWAIWVRDLYEDLINKHYHELENIPGYSHLMTRGWSMGDT